jgi:hypothetical protein
MMALPRSSSEASTAFRLPKEMLETIDILCRDFDTSRSQLYRRACTELIRTLGHQRNLQTPSNVPPPKPEDPKWGPELVARIEQHR